MSINYEDARDIARRNTEPGWSVGTYYMDDRDIIENDEYYVFIIGAREYLVDGDGSYALQGAIPVVYKDDGSFSWVASPKIASDKTLRVSENPNSQQL